MKGLDKRKNVLLVKKSAFTSVLTTATNVFVVNNFAVPLNCRTFTHNVPFPRNKPLIIMLLVVPPSIFIVDAVTHPIIIWLTLWGAVDEITVDVAEFPTIARAVKGGISQVGLGNVSIAC